ncbi:Fe-S cluster assembly protein SufD [Herbiconiux ginsengi]|uniref:Iron-regulated ABC transporter permease protein SufD n=1 Tax=Herbiconiux ginsengi TaxID=381665 RepID=A0A1H3PWA0_9MICO|nr:Fe-S cluster assembly protein SufD [Herbiconiux ginsengi]SDZ05250.1 Iron-regulated ABC transporter permease protein SufD [Herbiconiux ginsengi]
MAAPETTAPAARVEPVQHGFQAHSDGGSAFVPVQTRSERFTSTSADDFAAVTGLEFEWKFAPMAKIAHLTAEPLDGSVVEVAADAVDGFSVDWIAHDDALIGSAGAPEDRASANAWSTAEKALHVRVSGEEGGELIVRRTGFGSAPRAAHVVIEAAPNSRGVVILEHSGAANLAENVEIIVREGAQLTVVTVQEWDDEALHLSSHFATVGRDANLRHVIVSLGGSVVRVNPAIHLVEQGASTDAFGLYFADAGQFLEQRPYIDHVAANTRSRVNYKGALQGKGAHTVWVGDVLIGPHADGTDSYEQNRNLVLSEGTRADSIPNLEIETGNIVGAGHASSTGRFDDEQLFYLQSRGISEEEARRLVVRGFLAEIIQQIGSPALEERLAVAVEAELIRSQAAE